MSAPSCCLRATNLARQLRLAQPRVASAFSSRTRAISTRRPLHSTNSPRAPEHTSRSTQWQTKHADQTNNPRGGHQKSQNVLLAGASGASLIVLGVAVSNHDSADEPQATAEDQLQASPADGRDPSRPRYRLSDIREQHGPGSKNPWVTFEDKVYDITDWVGAHPGGDVILRAAGGAIEPYWDIFTIHKATHVREILNQYMIGYIATEDLDQRTGRPAAETIEDPFSTDPVRDQRLIKHTAKPCNAEPPPEELTKDFITPPELFYVRNHMWVPVVKEDQADDYALTIELPDGEERVYTLAELRSRFPLHRVTAALQCSGNRRSDMTSSTAATNGLQWGVGAISNTNWEGVRLADVLLDAGLKPGEFVPTALTTEGKDDADSREMHVQFSALEAYGASIPLSTALDPRADVLLAFDMNGKPLPRDHGYPLRTIVPGHVAARSVKWLNKIVVSDEESPSQWQRRDYKCFGPNEGSKPDWDRYPAIQEMPITSATTGVWVGDCVRAAAAAAKSGTEWMLRRTDEARAAPGVRDLPAWQREHLNSKDPKYAPKMDGSEGDVPVALMGYAYSGGGKHIIRVDVSVDGGSTWAQAELLDDCGPGGTNCKGSKYWAWRRWRYVGSLPELHETQGDKKCTTVLVKATDSAYNTQPEQHTGIYNVRGNLATAWHRLLICPSCVKKPDGKTTWCTGNGVYGSGFCKPEAIAIKT
ncbi:hypothetical protein PpBr36_02820 [Pyricularia pennisetigena]|uniref:hypothetical protein n=1 Tax=Pyricularia pennisetigena TaxID=1578925 RepID=UPI001152CE58|nr:hypothetical protein PpBr36_02820 [Pyricularia pennisetigena]TLS30119.1 hypothetical protein PpBr36_02820 [Pyricularia pennisetigena]